MRERLMQPLKSRAERAAGTLLWRGSDLIARREVSYDVGNIKKVKDHLAQGGSLIVVINHAHSLDTPVVGHVIENLISPLDGIGAIIALKHSDPERHKFDKAIDKREYTLIDLAKKSRGFKLLRVVQKTPTEKPPTEQEYYTAHPEALGGKTIEQFNADSLQEARTILRTGGIVMVAPEGTRSKDGNIQEAQPITELLLRGAKDNALVLPIRMIRQNGVFKVRIGDAFSYDELMEEHTNNRAIKLKDLIMRRVAKLIPAEKRGFYAGLT